MGLRAALVVFLAICVCRDARAASIVQIGANGAPGTAGIDSPPAPSPTNGGNGGAGEAATATAGPNADAANDATAKGGDGGRGGDGGTTFPGVSPAGSGGIGGNGADANARAETAIDGADALAVSRATGGAGGAAGLSGTVNGGFRFQAQGGLGGNATSQSIASNDGGTAGASATAIGGAAGTSLGTRLGGTANADAVVDGLGDTDANASAVGGATTGDSSPTFGASATAHASATSSSGDATATAEARGGDAIGPSGFAGLGSPTAEAFAPNGDATATARSIGGSGNFGGVGASLGPTAASGGASGRLTLIQEAIGGDSANPGAAFDTFSTLVAENSYGGALLGESIAKSGINGGFAVAGIEGHSSSNAPVEVRASATGAGNSHPAACSSPPCGVVVDLGSRPISNAAISAPASADLAARSRAIGFNALLQETQSRIDASGGGDLAGGGASIASIGQELYTGRIVASLQEISQSVAASTTANRAAPQVDLSALQARSAEANTYLHASPSDVAAWTAGNPGTLAELAKGGEVLALSSVAIASDSGVDLSYRGTLSVSLDVTEQPFRGITVAFLDPSVIGSIDLLHLAFRSGDSLLFEETFSNTADALAALDDEILPAVSFIGNGASGQVELQFNVSFVPGDVPPALAFDLAFLSVVPEPGSALLVVVGALTILWRRRDLAHSSSKPSYPRAATSSQRWRYLGAPPA